MEIRGSDLRRGESNLKRRSNVAIDCPRSSQLLSAAGTKGLKGYTRYWDQCTQTPFLWNYSKRHMINYDDATSAGAKAVSWLSPLCCGVFSLFGSWAVAHFSLLSQAYAKAQGLAGV